MVSKPIKNMGILLENDLADLAFSLFLETSPNPEGWNKYHCALLLRDPRTNDYRQLYSSSEGQVISDLPTTELISLSNTLNKAIENKNQSFTFVSETGDYSIDLKGMEDIFAVKVSLDLNALTSDNIEAERGDAALTLNFQSTISEITHFRDGINLWLKG